MNRKLLTYAIAAVLTLASCGLSRSEPLAIRFAQADDAQKRIDEKLKALEPKAPEGCEAKMAGAKVAGFSLRCDTLIPFGALLGAVPVSQTAADLEDCAARCRRVPKCVAFSYDGGAAPGSRACYLTGSLTEYRKAPNWISGTR